MSDSGEPGKLVQYRNIVFEQLKIADELHIGFYDTEKMSLLDRKYALSYLDMKYKAIEESRQKYKDKNHKE